VYLTCSAKNTLSITPVALPLPAADAASRRAGRQGLTLKVHHSGGHHFRWRDVQQCVQQSCRRSLPLGAAQRR
jgi:hypothetical protein